MEFRGKSLKGKTLDLDFNQFIDCRFDNCTLIYHGYGDVGLDGCVFGENVRWEFADAAAATVTFMRGIYHGGDVR